MLFLVKYLYIFVSKVSLNRSKIVPFMSGLWVNENVLPGASSTAGICINKFSNIVCIVIGLYFQIKILKLLWFRKQSFHLELRYWNNAKICLRRSGVICTYRRISRVELNLQDPFPRHNQYLFEYMGLWRTFSLPVYALFTCPDLKNILLHNFYYFHRLLPTLILNQTMLLD